MATTLFVYGTLMHGMGNNRHLGRGARFEGRATTTGLFRMWDVGFPLIIPARNGEPHAGRVAGELWRVTPDGLVSTDRLESNGSMYRRTLTAVRDERGNVRHVEGYVWMRGTPRTTHDGDVVVPRADGTLVWKESML
jgi:gamma-glutamylcyclotransferase (GGCT)/AIG2-like uncharacterized protein YtfP